MHKHTCFKTSKLTLWAPAGATATEDSLSEIDRQSSVEHSIKRVSTLNSFNQRLSAVHRPLSTHSHTVLPQKDINGGKSRRRPPEWPATRRVSSSFIPPYFHFIFLCQEKLTASVCGHWQLTVPFLLIASSLCSLCLVFGSFQVYFAAVALSATINTDYWIGHASYEFLVFSIFSTQKHYLPSLLTFSFNSQTHLV